MRVGIIRGDLPANPIYLGDLEVISQYDPAIEPPGQTYYVSYPTTTVVSNVLADLVVGAGATIEGTTISVFRV